VHAQQDTWNLVLSKSIQTVATVSSRVELKLDCGMAFHARSSRKELRCLTNVRTLSAATSFVISIKESYLKLKFNTPRVHRATVKPSQAMAKDMLNGVGCAISVPPASLCALMHGWAR